MQPSGNVAAVLHGGRDLRIEETPMPRLDATIPLNYLQTHELVLTGTFRYANTYPAAIALAASGRVNLESLITGYFGLEQTESALCAARDDESSIKSMIAVVP